MHIVLASTSRHRNLLMQRLGVPFEVAEPLCDENTFKSQFSDPRDLAVALSVAKAKSVQHLFPESILIGSDQVVAVDSDILGKAGSLSSALEQLRRLSG